MSATKVMNKQPTIADVLHYAADKCLVYDKRYTADDIKEKFSCIAVEEAIFCLTGALYSIDSVALYRRVMSGLTAMGCDTGNDTLFKKYGDNPDEYGYINPEVQGMRYMWLKWAALMAEEQGV